MLRVTETVEPNLNFSAEIHSAPPHPPFPLITRPNREKESPHSTKNPLLPALFLFSSKNSGQSPGAKLGFSAARDTLAHVSRVNYRAPGRGSIKYRFLGGAHAASTNRVSCSHLMSCIRMPRAHVQRAAERVHVRRCIQRRHVGGAP